MFRFIRRRFLRLGAQQHNTTTSTTTTAPAVSGDCHGLPPTASYAPTTPLPPPTQLPSGSPMAAIAAKGHMTVGVSGDTLLFGYRNPFTGQIQGFDIDVLRWVAEAIFGPGGGDKLDFKVITYAQRIPSLQDHSVDLVAHTMTINCARWNQIAFSSTYYDAGQKVLVRTDAAATTIQQLNEAGARVCAPNGSTNIDELKNFPGVKVLGVDDVTDCLVDFQQGKVDAITADDTVLAGFAAQDPYAKVSGDRFTDEPYGIGANSDDVALVQFVNGVLAAARADGRWTALYDKWLGAFGPAPAPPTPTYGRSA